MAQWFRRFAVSRVTWVLFKQGSEILSCLSAILCGSKPVSALTRVSFMLLHCVYSLSNFVSGDLALTGFNSRHQHLTSTVLEHLVSGGSFPGLGLGHMCWSGALAVIIAVVYYIASDQKNARKGLEKARPLVFLPVWKILKNQWSTLIVFQPSSLKCDDRSRPKFFSQEVLSDLDILVEQHQ